MDARLQEMLDHHEIRKTLAEYCTGCDRNDEAFMASVYAKGAFDAHGDRAMPGAEFAKAISASIATTTEVMFHDLGQSLIKVTGDTAAAETYFFATSTSRQDDGTVILNQLGGRFVDQFVRVGDGWKISYRDVVREWTLSQPVTSEWDSALNLQPAQRSGADPVYRVLGLTHSGPPTMLAGAE